MPMDIIDANLLNQMKPILAGNDHCHWEEQNTFCANEVDPSAMSSKWGRVQHHYDIEL